MMKISFVFLRFLPTKKQVASLGAHSVGITGVGIRKCELIRIIVIAGVEPRSPLQVGNSLRRLSAIYE